MVSRTVVVVLGIVCIVLGVTLLGAIVMYQGLLDSKNRIIYDHDYQISNMNSQISTLNSQIQNLTNQKNQLQKIVDLHEGTVLVDSQTKSQTAGSYSLWTYSASYAGYVEVIVESSTTTNTYIRVIYSSSTTGVNYDSQTSVGTQGIGSFPILPASNIQIRVGNTNLINGATETVSIYTFP